MSQPVKYNIFSSASRNLRMILRFLVSTKVKDAEAGKWCMHACILIPRTRNKQRQPCNLARAAPWGARVRRRYGIVRMAGAQRCAPRRGLAHTIVLCPYTWIIYKVYTNYIRRVYKGYTKSIQRTYKWYTNGIYINDIYIYVMVQFWTSCYARWAAARRAPGELF